MYPMMNLIMKNLKLDGLLRTQLKICIGRLITEIIEEMKEKEEKEEKDIKKMVMTGQQSQVFPPINRRNRIKMAESYQSGRDNNRTKLDPTLLRLIHFGKLEQKSHQVSNCNNWSTRELCKNTAHRYRG